MKTHLICVIPGYDAPIQATSAHSTTQGALHSKANHRQRNGKSSTAAMGVATGRQLSHQSLQSPQQQMIEVNLMVKSGGKCSDPHQFYYLVGGGGGISPVANLSHDPTDSTSSFDHQGKLLFFIFIQLLD